VLSRVGRWYAAHLNERHATKSTGIHTFLPRKTIVMTILVLLTLIFSKFFYLASMTNYYTFYLIQKFGVSIQQSQMYLFAFLFATAAGTLVGGHLGDKIGRKAVIWISILGMAPFSLLLPYGNLFWTAVLSVITAFIMSSAFPA